MTAVHVFDPAMCCSTGICGTTVDPQLARFAADLAWLKGQGVSVERFNLSQQPGKFAEDAAVKSALETKGEAGLPLVKVNGEVKSSGAYPTRDQLAAWASVETAQPLPRESLPQAGSGACCDPVKIGPTAAKGTGCC